MILAKIIFPSDADKNSISIAEQNNIRHRIVIKTNIAEPE
jgi:hypothetical protein